MLPEPAPQILMDATGTYWRRFADGSMSMVPVSDHNDPIIGPLAVYNLVAIEHHDGTQTDLTRDPEPAHPVPDGGERGDNDEVRFGSRWLDDTEFAEDILNALAALDPAPGTATSVPQADSLPHPSDANEQEAGPRGALAMWRDTAPASPHTGGDDA